MWFKSVGYIALLLITEGLTALVGIIFVAIAWATYFDAREQNGESKTWPLYTFAFAALANAFGLLALWFGPPDISPFIASGALLVLSWIFLVLTLLISRGNSAREIATIKAGCSVLLAIGGLSIICFSIG